MKGCHAQASLELENLDNEFQTAAVEQSGSYEKNKGMRKTMIDGNVTECIVVRKKGKW